MGTTTKVFIVLNLIIAFVMAAAAITVFGKQAYWVEEVRKSVETGNNMYADFKSQNDTLSNELDLTKNELTQAKAQLDSTTEKLGIKTQENNDLLKQKEQQKLAMDQINEAISELQSIVAAKEKRNGELQSKLDQEIRKASAFSKQVEWSRSQAIELAATLKESENEMLQLGKSNSELVRRVTLLSTQLEKYVKRYGADPESSMVAAGVSINGRVMQIEPELELVILSVGEKDKVKKGMEFVISRGDDYISKVRVDNVYADMSSARIIRGMTGKGKDIKVSDMASILE